MVSKDQEVGTVIWVGDGIATIYGIEHAMYGEICLLYTSEIKVAKYVSHVPRKAAIVLYVPVP